MLAATVKIWGKVVGAVAWDPGQEYATFEFDERFRELGWDISPLKLPVSSTFGPVSFPELRRTRNARFDTFKGLPGLLADALPDSYGNQLINVWLSRQGRPENSMNPVEMLCFMGKRGMGALEFQPAITGSATPSFKVELDAMVDAARRVLHQRESFATNLRDEQDQAILDILSIGTSAGGARPKAVIAWNEQTGEVRSGQTQVSEGFEHWLIKLDGVSEVQLGSTYGYGRVEMAYHNMAKASGITMMPCRLLEENGRAHFMTQRFDRDGGRTKHHVQTFCAMKHADFNLVNSFSYEQLFQCMRELKLAYSDAEQMFRRMVFNVVARNCDDHTKNFAFLLKQGGKWELAPAYDLCHAYRPGSEWVSQHALSINGKRKDITREDVLAIAASIRCKTAPAIIDEINQVVHDWSLYAREVGVPQELEKSISDTFYFL